MSNEDPYAGIGGDYIINAKGERVPAAAEKPEITALPEPEPAAPDKAKPTKE